VGIPIATRPAAFTGWYKFVADGRERRRVFRGCGALQGWGYQALLLAVAATISRTAVSSFTQFSIPFQYVSNLVPDTAFIEFTIVDTSSTATVVPGSFYVLDDIAFLRDKQCGLGARNPVHIQSVSELPESLQSFDNDSVHRSPRPATRHSRCMTSSDRR